MAPDPRDPDPLHRQHRAGGGFRAGGVRARGSVARPRPADQSGGMDDDRSEADRHRHRAPRCRAAPPTAPAGRGRGDRPSGRVARRLARRFTGRRRPAGAAVPGLFARTDARDTAGARPAIRLRRLHRGDRGCPARRAPHDERPADPGEEAHRERGHPVLDPGCRGAR